MTEDNIKKLADTLGIISLVSGQTVSGEDFWAYISVPPSKYEDFLKAQEAGDYTLTDWGDIMRYGAGQSPSAEIKAEMEELYGINHDLENIVRDLADALGKDDN